MLFLAGLPTLFPKLVESRTYAERMFRVLFLDRLTETESEKAIRIPTARQLTDDSVRIGADTPVAKSTRSAPQGTRAGAGR